MVRMRKSRLSQAKQNRLMEHFVAGTTARCAAALVGVNSKTAVYYFHRLREIVCYHLELEADNVVDGEIEVDEAYFGGRRKGKRGGKVYTKIISTPRQRDYSPSLSARWSLTASSIRTAGAATTCWTSRHLNIIASITRSSLLTSTIISTVSRTFGTRRSVICGNSTVFRNSTLGYF